MGSLLAIGRGDIRRGVAIGSRLSWSSYREGNYYREGSCYRDLLKRWGRGVPIEGELNFLLPDQKICGIV